MTREEAIEILDRRTTIPNVEYTWEQINQAIDMAISALRPVSREQELEAENKELKERIVNWRKYMAPTREQVEIWRGEWEMNSNWPDTIICSKCAHRFDVWKHEEKDFHFCPHCGAPMTDEAVQMMMERLEAVFQ